MIRLLDKFAVAASISLTLSLNTPAAMAQECFVDTPPQEEGAAQYETRIRSLMVAHAPIEYRRSCGIQDESDQRFYEAIRSVMSCEESQNYDVMFGQYLGETPEYFFAVDKSELQTEEAFDVYCQIIERIDLGLALNDDGTINREMLQAQTPLFNALQEHVFTNRRGQ